MSNFDSTDKNSLRWFILLPSGHVGPYSIEQLIELKLRHKINAEVKIWAEDLGGPYPLDLILQDPITQEEDSEVDAVISEILSTPEEFKNNKSVRVRKTFLVTLCLLGFFLLIGGAVIGSRFFVKNKEQFYINRLKKITPDLYERILSESSFQGWGKEIFFREYVSDDYSHLWLVTSSYQQCDVDISINSLPGKLLSMKQDRVSFKSKGRLSNHVVELFLFHFSSGNRIIPGLYEMDVRAYNCQWDGVISHLMNHFSGPESEYVARTKVILFSKGSQEFSLHLNNFLKKKLELQVKNKGDQDHFLQGLVQKFQTLEAVSLQIEQHFLDFMNLNPKEFNQNVGPMVHKYSRTFGTFLTSFILENEKDFKNRSFKKGSRKINYELMIRLLSKKIGLISMNIIEELQAIKSSPSQKKLKGISAKVTKNFSEMIKDINEKLSLASQDLE